MKTLASLLLGLSLTISSFGAEKKPTTAEHLQNVSVTIRAEAEWSAGEGSGVIFTRKDKDGNLVNLVWTAGHIIDNLRTERKVLVNGSPKVLVEFKDPVVIKEIRQNGRTVGRLQMDAEVLKYSESEDGHDLALLRVRKLNFVTDSVKFYLEKSIPPLGTDLLHVGSLLGQFGANSMTDGIYSQHGRVIKSLNKHIFDQTTCVAFPGSSGGGVYLKKDGDARYIGMLVRGAGEGFNLIVPVRRMVNYCQKHKIMWALDPKVAMPSEDDLKKIPVENTPREKEEAKNAEKEATKKMFPFMIRKVDYLPNLTLPDRKLPTVRVGD
ncbi:hypothetical protein CMI37_22170 [Candidatus Pacearchaeota archaeon]|nr:hypothetical protein [Candidatus Pacearchaeota archaeon]|tara:strand:- start:14163 stop:15131 length:969 start_codon:yes stop_codon:yes gene_type:complete